MGSKRRAPTSTEEVKVEIEAEKEKVNEFTALKPEQEPQKKNLKPMERRKKRKQMDKEKHHSDPKSNAEVNDKAVECPPVKDVPFRSSSAASSSRFHINVFRDLAAADLSVRKAAAETLAVELIEVQRAYERMGGEKGGEEEGAVQLEAEKDDGLENCAPSLRYAIRRLIRGVSSSRECARQGFALGLSIVVAKIPTIKVESLMKLIVNLLEVSASMKGQEAKDCLLGCLFAYGSLARSGRVTAELSEDIDTSSVKDFVGTVMSLAGKKRYLMEPAVSIILDVVEKLPLEAVTSHVLDVPGIKECFQKAAKIGDPDSLFLALKLKERVPMESEAFGKLLPSPFSPDNFFTRDHLSNLVPCFKESTFCHPRVHSLWHLLVNILVPPMVVEDEATSCAHSGKKQKKSRKGGSFEEMIKNIRCFCEVVIEESLLLSSHERKHLALMIILLLLPRLPTSCVPIVLSYKLVHCLMDILPTKGSHLHEAALYFVKELVNWIGGDDDRRVSVIVALQKHSSGRFDCITKTQTVKELVGKLVTAQSCLLFIHKVISLFVEDGILADEPSDQSQTTDENSEIGSVEDKNSIEGSGNIDTLKGWIVDTMPRVLKNLKLDSNAKSWADTEIVKFLEERFRVQAEIMKFLAVQGLLSASLGTEVTSFELQEKFKWPKAAISMSLRRRCIEQLQLLLEDAQRGEVSDVMSSGLEKNDFGSYFMSFLKTTCNIPSVSLYRKLSEKDQEAFKKLQKIESKLLQEERKLGCGPGANKLHALRYVLIQLVLQVLLCPEEFYEAASELAICCEKAFLATGAAHGDSFRGEDEFDDNEMPDLMDVLLETFLSLLPSSSGPMCFAIEQAFRLFCDDLTIDGILRMLRVVKKDLKPLRQRYRGSDVDDSDDEDVDDDFLGIEDLEETSKANVFEAGDEDDQVDDNQRMLGGEITGEGVTENVEVESGGTHGEDASSDDEANQNFNDHSASDDSDGDMDDDAMLMRDSTIVDILKQRVSSGKDNTLSQLLAFKSRVLSLLEILLQKHPGKSQVLMIYSYLVRAFVKYHSAQKNQLQQLGLRIKGILQKKMFKAKDYPKGDDILLASLEPLLEKSLRSASRYPDKEISSLAQLSTFWLLKVIQSRNFDRSELGRVVELFQRTLIDYLESKKCRLKSGFVKEVIRRHPWIGHELFGFLLEKCGVVKSEFRRIEALEVVDCVMKSCTPTVKGGDASSKSSTKLLKKHIPTLCDLIHVLLSRLPEKESRRAEVRRFCTRALSTISVLNLKKSFLKALKPEALSLCEIHLGNAFLSFKKPAQ